MKLKALRVDYVCLWCELGCQGSLVEWFLEAVKGVWRARRWPSGKAGGALYCLQPYTAFCTAFLQGSTSLPSLTRPQIMEGSAEKSDTQAQTRLHWAKSKKNMLTHCHEWTLRSEHKYTVSNIHTITYKSAFILTHTPTHTNTNKHKLRLYKHKHTTIHMHTRTHSTVVSQLGITIYRHYKLSDLRGSRL